MKSNHIELQTVALAWPRHKCVCLGTMLSGVPNQRIPFLELTLDQATESRNVVGGYSVLCVCTKGAAM